MRVTHQEIVESGRSRPARSDSERCNRTLGAEFATPDPGPPNPSAPTTFNAGSTTTTTTEPRQLTEIITRRPGAATTVTEVMRLYQLAANGPSL